MNRAILISLALHLAAVAGVAWGFVGGTRAVGPPLRRTWGVDLVGSPGARGWPAFSGGPGSGGQRPTPAVPKTDLVRSKARSGVRVDKAPSTDPFAPKGTKKPTRTSSQKPGEGGTPGGGRKGAPGGGGGGLRLEGEQPFPFPDYLRHLVDRIQERWDPLVAAGQTALKTTVFFRVLKDGTVSEAWVETSSGLNPFDRAALKAVLDASPIEPLPEMFKSDRLGVYFDFEY